MTLNYKSYNHFGYTQKELTIDFEKKVYCVDPLTMGKPDFKTSSKKIEELITDLEENHYTKLSNKEWHNR